MSGPKNRKDFQLLDYMRKTGEEYAEERIAKKIYGQSDKASFYRLKNRLHDDLGDYLTLHHTWKGDFNQLSRNLSLYSIFLHKNQFNVALFYLKKAEQKALSIENFEMLDVIYGNFVKISNDLMEVNPEVYIKKRKENAERLNKARDADQALAAISYRAKITQNFSSGKRDTLKILRNTIKEFAGDASLSNSKSFQTRIYRALSQILLAQHNYGALEKFLYETYTSFEKQKWFDKQNHEVKLQMLTYLVNSLFRNEKYTESLTYAEILGTEIKAYNSLLYDKFLFFYYNSLVINYSALDQKKALSILEEFEAVIKNKENSYYDQFLYFNKAMLLHQLGKPSQAIRNIVKLYVNDNYKKAAESFKLKISVAELIMHFDAGDSDSYLPRSKSIKQQFNKLLTEGDFARDRNLIQLMDKMIANPGFRKDAALKKKVHAFIKAKVDRPTIDSEIILYSSWLSSKWGEGPRQVRP
jgi:hypothetical protein